MPHAIVFFFLPQVHTGLKPFECKLCDYRTTQKHHLKAHMRTHGIVDPDGTVWAGSDGRTVPQGTHVSSDKPYVRRTLTTRSRNHTKILGA